jgi:hypothetical protein
MAWKKRDQNGSAGGRASAMSGGGRERSGNLQCSRRGWSGGFDGVEHVELLPHLGGVEQVHESAFARAGSRHLAREARCDPRSGVVDEKRFLRNDAYFAASGIT